MANHLVTGAAGFIGARIAEVLNVQTFQRADERTWEAAINLAAGVGGRVSVEKAKRDWAKEVVKP